MRRHAQLRRQGGFSLIEILIGAALFLIVVIGILPLFTRAMVDNTAGSDYTQSTNMAKSMAEELDQAPFNSAQMTIPSGQNFLENKQVWSKTAEAWTTDNGVLPAGALWRRTTRVRQYSLSDLTEDTANPIFDHPLPGGTAAAFIHLKELDIQVQNVTPQQGALGARRQMNMRVFKPF
jgi:Tfp pilus assembly protein PilV